MPSAGNKSLARRDVLAGAVALGALALPGMALPGAAFAAEPAAGPVQRLLMLAARDAFNRLSAPYGFWGSRVARFGLPVLFRKGIAPGSPLATAKFREDLQERLNIIAEAGARGAAPVVVEAARALVIANPATILRGAPTAGTSYLRLEMASGLVNALIAPLHGALLAAQEPLVAQAMATLPGVTLQDVAHSVALEADNGIWYEIGASEMAIRANPTGSNDPELIAALRGA